MFPEFLAPLQYLGESHSPHCLAAFEETQSRRQSRDSDVSQTLLNYLPVPLNGYVIQGRFLNVSELPLTSKCSSQKSPQSCLEGLNEK